MHNAAYDVVGLLSDLARLVRTEADKRARCQGMTRAQWVILVRLQASPGLSQRELAAILEVEPITVGRLVDRLESRGLVERRPDPDDRRIWRLHLLPGAGPVLDALHGQKEAIADLVSEGLTQTQIVQMCETMLRMKANISSRRRPTAELGGADLLETA
jgi:DNA-binding MarR family transcriptional regulator